MPKTSALKTRSFASAATEKPRILITGSLGQIGTGFSFLVVFYSLQDNCFSFYKILLKLIHILIGLELAVALRNKYGHENVIATDVKKPENPDFLKSGTNFLN